MRRQGAGGRGQGAGGRGKENLKYVLPISPSPHLLSPILPPAPCPLPPCLFPPSTQLLPWIIHLLHKTGVNMTLQKLGVFHNFLMKPNSRGQSGNGTLS